MKKRILSVLVAIVVLTVGANTQDPMSAAAKKLPAGEAPTIDGVIDGLWLNTDPLPINIVPTGQQNNGYAVSAGGSWSVCWNDDGVFGLIKWTDDVHVRDTTSTTHEDDGFDIALAWGDGVNAEAVDTANSGFLVINIEKDGKASFGPKSNFHNIGMDGILAAHSAITSANGNFDLEFFIPWANLNTEPAAGVEIRMDPKYNDDDGNNLEPQWTPGSGREKVIQWGTHADGKWNVSGDWGLVTLSDEELPSVPTSVKELSSSSFNLYPNPTSASINVSNVDFGTQIEIINIAGQVVAKASASELVTNVDVSNLEPGVYFIKLNNTGKKFIIE